MNPAVAPMDVNRRQWERTSDLLERLAVLPEQAQRAAAVEVGQTESEVVYRENKLELHHYEPGTVRHDVPILVVYALINRPYVLDLQPDRSVVRSLLDAGFEVYLIDWDEPSRLDTTLGMADYVTRYVDNCVDVVRERAGRDAINVLGYCMGGSFSAMYAALYPEKVKALGLMASGLVFEDTGGVLELWGDDDYYDPGTVADTYGNVPAEFLDVGFALMDPVDNFVTKYAQLVDNLDDDEFVENFAAMEQWLSDGIDVAGRVYTEFLEAMYQSNRLARDELELDGEPVSLDRIEMPVLQIVGTYDHLVPPESSVPFNDLVASDDTTVIEFPTGHIGLSVSASSHAELWPQVCEWYAARSDSTDDGAEGTDETGESPDEAEEPPGSERGLDAITGIGAAYATRLEAAGVESVDALATADPDSLADTIDVPPVRTREWVEQARRLTDEETEQ